MAVATKSKKSKIDLDPKKTYRFELFDNNDSLVPVDGEGRKRAPFPVIWVAQSSGLGINPDNQQMEEWRYVHSFQKSIWKSDQPINIAKSQLEDPRNEIVFRKGICTIKGIEPAKFAALQIQDCFDKCESPINASRPKSYFLVDQEEINEKVKDTLDDAYEAEKAAREMDNESMYAIASLFGVDLDQTDKAIRTQLIIKSKEHPLAFLRDLVDPKHKARFIFLRALQENLISGSVILGKCVWVDTGEALFDVKVDVDLADELAKKWAQKLPAAEVLYERIKAVIVD